MNKLIKIAGVLLDKDNLPSKEDLVKSALQSKGFYRLDKKDAIKAINEQIKKSGLYNSVQKRSEESKPERD